MLLYLAYMQRCAWCVFGLTYFLTYLSSRSGLWATLQLLYPRDINIWYFYAITVYLGTVFLVVPDMMKWSRNLHSSRQLERLLGAYDSSDDVEDKAKLQFRICEGLIEKTASEVRKPWFYRDFEFAGDFCAPENEKTRCDIDVNVANQ